MVPKLRLYQIQTGKCAILWFTSNTLLKPGPHETFSDSEPLAVFFPPKVNFIVRRYKVETGVFPAVRPAQQDMAAMALRLTTALINAKQREGLTVLNEIKHFNAYKRAGSRNGPRHQVVLLVQVVRSCNAGAIV